VTFAEKPFLKNHEELNNKTMIKQQIATSRSVGNLL
jgi:hypothetical protein